MSNPFRSYSFEGTWWWFCLMFLALFGIIVLGALADSYSCSSRAERMGFPSSYGPFEGCLIRVEGKWIPYDSYRTIGNLE